MADETPKQPAAAEAPAPSPKAPVRPPDAKENFRYIVRLANTDLEGARSVVYALTKVKGLGVRIAETVADLSGVSRKERIGNLTDAETEKIEDVLSKIAELVPHWMENRPNDWYTGTALHAYNSDIQLL